MTATLKEATTAIISSSLFTKTMNTYATFNTPKLSIVPIKDLTTDEDESKLIKKLVNERGYNRLGTRQVYASSAIITDLYEEIVENASLYGFTEGDCLEMFSVLREITKIKEELELFKSYVEYYDNQAVEFTDFNLLSRLLGEASISLRDTNKSTSVEQEIVKVCKGYTDKVDAILYHVKELKKMLK